MRRRFATLSFLLGGCISTTAVSSERTADPCPSVIEFQGWQFTVKGIESGTFKLGEAAFGKQKLQDAQQLAQALDIIMIGDCRLLNILAPDDPLRAKIIEGQTQTMALLMQNLGALQAAKTPDEASKAIDDAKKSTKVVAAQRAASVDPPPAADNAKKPTEDTTTATTPKPESKPPKKP